MTMALIDAAFDRSEECQDIIGLSLFNLGKKRPGLVLSSCNSYLKKHSKVCHGTVNCFCQDEKYKTHSESAVQKNSADCNFLSLLFQKKKSIV